MVNHIQVCQKFQMQMGLARVFLSKRGLSISSVIDGEETATKIIGAIQFIGTLASNCKDISDQCTHDSVQTGTSKSGKVS
jgi:hypothetical protein